MKDITIPAKDIKKYIDNCLKRHQKDLLKFCDAKKIKLKKYANSMGASQNVAYRKS